jgi:MFS family permease
MDQTESKKTIRTFALASFLNDFGADMVHSLWPIFLTQTLGLNMFFLGLIEGVGDALISISQAVSGYISDRIHRRKIFIWVGYLLSAVSRIGSAMAHGWPLALTSKVIERTGKMRDAPRDAIAAEVSDRSNRGSNFGILRTMDSLGGVCGALIALYLVRFLPIRTIFLYASIPSIIGVFVILLVVKEQHNGITLYEGLHWKNLSRSFRWFLLLSAIFSIGSFSYSFLIIFAKNFGFPIVVIPALYLVYMIGATVVSYPFGHMADLVGRRIVILLGFIFWAFTMAALILHQGLFAVFLSFVFFGFSKGALETVQRTFVSELAPSGYVASALGTYKLVVGLAALPASLVAGALWDRFGMFMPFYLSLILTAIASVMLIFVDGK